VHSDATKRIFRDFFGSAIPGATVSSGHAIGKQAVDR
jgi:hypothetical protein